MNIDTSTTPIWTDANQQERILDQWKRLYHETELLIDAMTWIDGKRIHKQLLEEILWDMKKLVARLEYGLK